jgi:hypothetical protein
VKFKNCNPATISAISALVAIGFSIFVYVQTRKLLAPTERPVISIFETQGQDQSTSVPSRTTGILLFGFKNIGKHPAKNLRLRIGAVTKKNPESFQIDTDVSIANRLDVENIFSWRESYNLPIKMEGKKPSSRDKEIFIYLLLTYEDAYQPKKTYYDEFWLSYTPGHFSIDHATIEEKSTLEPYVKAALGNK